MAAVLLCGVGVIAGALPGCSPQPVAPDAGPPQAEGRAISHEPTGGVKGFFFLPPIAPAVSASNPFDGDLVAQLQVEAFLLGPDGKPTGDAVATFTGTPSGRSADDAIRVDTAAGQYIVNWHTDLFGLIDRGVYRVFVVRKLDHATYGFADAQVFVSAKQAKNLVDATIFPLNDGRTLPIKWRIDQGCAPVVPPSAPGPWPMFRQNVRHTGLSSYIGAQTPTTKWVFPTGSNVESSPAIGADGTVYVGSWDGKLYAINSDGTKKWEFPTGNGVRSSPAIGADGTVYVGSYDHNLYAINSDGRIKWLFPTGGRITWSSPTISVDGTVYVGSADGNLYAISPDGTLKWAFPTGDEVHSSPAIGADGTIYVVKGNFGFYAINPNGTLKELFWKWQLSNQSSSPAIGADGTVYFGGGDGKVYAFNPDMTEKWEFPNPGGADIYHMYYSPAIGADGTVYVGSYDSNLYAINPDGTMKWLFPTGNVVWSSPAIGADGTVYVGSGDGKVYAINPDGTPKWDLVTYGTSGGTVSSSPAIGADGTVYVGGGDEKLYAIGP